MTTTSDVIGRYRTVGGATVEVRRVSSSYCTSSKAICTGHGCGWECDSNGHHGMLHSDTSYCSQDVADADAQRDAQQHAEKCRAMPKPGEPS